MRISGQGCAGVGIGGGRSEVDRIAADIVDAVNFMGQSAGRASTHWAAGMFLAVATNDNQFFGLSVHRGFETAPNLVKNMSSPCDSASRVSLHTK